MCCFLLNFCKFLPRFKNTITCWNARDCFLILNSIQWTEIFSHISFTEKSNLNQKLMYWQRFFNRYQTKVFKNNMFLVSNKILVEKYFRKLEQKNMLPMYVMIRMIACIKLLYMLIGNKCSFVFCILSMDTFIIVLIQ